MYVGFGHATPPFPQYSSIDLFLKSKGFENRIPDGQSLSLETGEFFTLIARLLRKEMGH